MNYDAPERAFAETVRKSLGANPPPPEIAAEIGPVEFYRSGGSSDVADVSWVGGNAVDAGCAMLGAVATMWDTLGWGGEIQALIYNPKARND